MRTRRSVSSMERLKNIDAVVAREARRKEF
jgi:hypothetical protein